jgi:hypothetical protein
MTFSWFTSQEESPQPRRVWRYQTRPVLEYGPASPDIADVCAWVSVHERQVCQLTRLYRAQPILLLENIGGNVGGVLQRP